MASLSRPDPLWESLPSCATIPASVTHTRADRRCVCVCERTFRAHVFQLRASCAAVLWETNKELLLCLWWDGVMRGETGALCVCVCVWFLGTLLIGWWATAAVGTDCWLAICHQEKCVYWCAPRSWVLSSLHRGETRWEGRSEWERERRINMQMSHGIMTGLDFEPLFAWLVWVETGRFGVCEILESCLHHTHHLTVFDNYMLVIV